MKRRELLRRTTAAVAVGATTGCLAESTDADGDEETATGAATTEDEGASTTADAEGPAEEETATETTGSETPTVRERGVATYEAECLSSDDEERAAVSFDDRRIDVEGAIALPDPCHEPALAAAEYDGDTLVVTVGAASGDDAEMCTQCTAIAEYLVRLGFDEGVPSAVRVEHETMGETRRVTDASP